MRVVSFMTRPLYSRWNCPR